MLILPAQFSQWTSMLEAPPPHSSNLLRCWQPSCSPPPNCHPWSLPAPWPADHPRFYMRAVPTISQCSCVACIAVKFCNACCAGFFPSKALQCYMSSCRHGVFFNILEGCSEDMTFWRGQINMNQPRIRLLQQNKSWDQRSLLLHRSTSASKRWCRWNRTIQARRFQHELKHKAVRLPGTAMESLYRHPHLCALGQLPNRATLFSYSGRSRCRDSG